MSGATDLKMLIGQMSPELHDGVYVFCSVSEVNMTILEAALGYFKEKEGITLVMSREEAERFGLAFEFEASWIELKIHSALEAVGLTAAVSKALTQEGISCNIIAGYYHDHLFVPKALADRALQALGALSAGH